MDMTAGKAMARRRIVAGRALAALGIGALVAACVPPQGRGPDGAPHTAAVPIADLGDGCGPQVTVFVSAGDLLGPARQAPSSPAELSAELAREAAALDRLQAAFDTLIYCRWTEVRLVREQEQTGRLAAPTARARIAQATARLRTDVARAAEFRNRIASRATGLDAAVEAARPGSRAAIARARPASLAAVSQDNVALRARPDGRAQEVGRVNARTPVEVGPAAHGFALVQAGSVRGFARADLFSRVPPRAFAAADDLRVLGASNVARREAFAETVALAQRTADTGFEAAL